MSLREYQQKRDFEQTSEPAGDEPVRSNGHQFVVQKHAARRLHYDFRLEWDGVLKSWAVPKGPCLDPQVKALAVQVEDHPLAYATFEGIIPQGEYGGGTVMVWDHGEWTPDGDPATGLKSGRLKFELHGEKLKGGWSLVRMKDRDDGDKKNWLLIKRSDEAARSQDDFEVTEQQRSSILTGRSMEQIAEEADKIWSSNGESRSRNHEPAANTNAAPVELQFDPAEISGARRAAMPEDFTPHLATSASQIPQGDDWLHELKFDGYRLLCFVDEAGIRLLTRRGNDWTDRFPAIAEALSDFQLTQTILDGELVALDAQGVSDFQRLQNWMRKHQDDQLVYYVFDVPYFAGYNLQQTPLTERKELAAQVILARSPANDGLIRYSDHVRGQGPEVLQHSCRHALEGVISKKADSSYENRRSRSWLKSKCQGRQEFVIGGFTKPQGSRTDFGALLVGYWDGDDLVYSGRVGTGFTGETLAQLGRQLRRLKRPTPPFVDPPTGAQARGVTWTEPELVAEVEFSEWTDDDLLRHPSFQGLREDKDARDVVKEQAAMTSTRTTPSSPARTPQQQDGISNQRNGTASVAGVTLSHPERVLFPEQGATKLEVARYYESIADWILPHIVDRPLTLVRCPQGRAKTCFYQKHWTESLPEAVESVLIREKDAEEPYVVVRDLTGLISLIQLSTLELHPWGARADRLERPDQIVFDLDPGEEVDFAQVKQAATEVRDVFSQAQLESFVRTSGGKGLHVVVPITRRNTWEDVGDFAQKIATGLSRHSPKRYVAKMRKSLRKGRIFIDYLRNRRGATAIASYSTRARPGAPVATPIAWAELSELTAADQWTIANVPERLQSLFADPWAGFAGQRQSITQAAQRIAAELNAA